MDKHLDEKHLDWLMTCINEGDVWLNVRRVVIVGPDEPTCTPAQIRDAWLERLWTVPSGFPSTVNHGDPTEPMAACAHCGTEVERDTLQNCDGRRFCCDCADDWEEWCDDEDDVAQARAELAAADPWHVRTEREARDANERMQVLCAADVWRGR